MGCWFEGVRLDLTTKRQQKAHENRMLGGVSINLNMSHTVVFYNIEIFIFRL